MHAFQEEYEKRKEEIESYLTLISVMDSDGAVINDIDDNHTVITSTQIKVCKASFYLILYNLVEATVIAGVISIYDRIRDEQLKFTDIKDELRKVWWHSKSESLTACGRNSLIEKVYEHYCDAINSSEIDFGRFVSGVSGNLSAETVREVCRRYGIETVGDGRDLESVKTHRNNLAHGNMSFSDIGQDLTPSQLVDVKIRTFTFLDTYVANINSYLEGCSYKVSA
ncbi:MAE_28990/MAE_18760 family HEPN-like nuclease [Vibrio chagasii]|uniref:MAE_28990/MAE_18760 family HEPN-like nuclease n=1 Tax=Vibrio chagasii TaxID=170679 RepID=UPI003BB7DDF0